MFRAKTVLVLGAGASAEVGLPVGSGLLESIVKLTNIKFEYNRQTSGDNLVLEALKLVLNEGGSVDRLNECIKAGWQLAASAQQALSIDNVIDALEDEKVETIGKLGIVRAIHQAERQSQFFKYDQQRFDRLDLTKFKNTWYDSLIKLLTENVKKSSVESVFDNLAIVNFNYDRCLEAFLPVALSNYYGVMLEKCQHIVDKLEVHRPYGVAGRLPWQQKPGAAVPFGGSGTHELMLAAQQIRTFTERVEEGEALQAIRDAIANAERVIFLGFAFHRQNVQLLAQAINKDCEILGTAVAISDSDRGVIKDELCEAFGIEFDLTDPQQSRVELTDLTCAAFFAEYWRTLTAEQRREEAGAFALIRDGS